MVFAHGCAAGCIADFLQSSQSNFAINQTAVSNLKCNTLTEGNVRKWERDTNTCSQKTE